MELELSMNIMIQELLERRLAYQRHLIPFLKGPPSNLLCDLFEQKSGLMNVALLTCEMNNKMCTVYSCAHVY